MEPFTRLTAVAVPLLRDNVDTDAIIPSREMKSVSKAGLADGLFAGWRYRTIGGREPDPTFVLNHPRYERARILLAGANFGCGSSREHAVWALAEYGFRVVIAPSFNPIFRGNCVANGLVPAVLAADGIAELTDLLADSPDSVMTVDLVDCKVAVGGRGNLTFAIDSEARETLLAGLDPIGRTEQMSETIAAFISADRQARPWIYAAVE